MIFCKCLHLEILTERPREGPLIDLLWPCPGSTPGGLGPKVNTNVRGHEYFIPTKFGKYPSSDSVVKADSVFPYIYMH